jgi:hypothetical protein
MPPAVAATPRSFEPDSTVKHARFRSVNPALYDVGDFDGTAFLVILLAVHQHCSAPSWKRSPVKTRSTKIVE